jgi:hypothetical protein
VTGQQHRVQAWQALQVLFSNRVQYTSNVLASWACAGSAICPLQLHDCMHAAGSAGQANLHKFTPMRVLLQKH